MEKCYLIIDKIDKNKISDTISLTYEERFLRRKKLTSDNGLEFLVNLPETKSLSQNQAFKLDNDELIIIKLKKEKLLEITGENLMQLIWHIGNRHIPCEIKKNKIFIQNDKVIENMIKKLGGKIKLVEQTFTPEGGAYGIGRTHSHKH